MQDENDVPNLIYYLCLVFSILAYSIQQGPHCFHFDYAWVIISGFFEEEKLAALRNNTATVWSLTRANALVPHL